MEPDRNRQPEMPPPADQQQATLLLERISAGQGEAANELLPMVYDQLRGIAGSYFRGQRPDHTLQPTALVHEAYMKLVRASDTDWKSRAHFCAVAATAMRQILRDHVDAKRAVKRGGGNAKRADLDVDQITTPSGKDTLDVMALEDALTALHQASERQGRIVELIFFGGLEVAEIAEVIEVSERTVARDWRTARAWLNTELSGASA